MGAGERTQERVLSSKPLHTLMCLAFLLGALPWCVLGATGARQYDDGFVVMRFFLAIFCGSFGALLVLDVGLFASLCHSSLLCACLRLSVVIYPVALTVGTLSTAPAILPLFITGSDFAQACISAFILSLASQVLISNVILLYFRGHLIRVTLSLQQARNLLGAQEQARLHSISAKVTAAAWTSFLVGLPTETILLLLRYTSFMQERQYIGFNLVMMFGAIWSGVMSYLFQPPACQEPDEDTGDSPPVPYLNQFDEDRSSKDSSDPSSFHSNRSHHEPISVHMPHKVST